MKKLTDVIETLARPVVEKHGCALWDVEYVKEAGDFILRVYIDKPGGIFIDDCEAVSREMDAILDEQDPIPNSYIFEVSSAGAERRLKRPSDFERFMGSPVLVKLYKAMDGRKEFPGVLTGYDDGAVSIDMLGTTYTFNKNDVALVRLRIV